MESIVRALVVYLFLFLVFRLAGKRTLSQSTPFELVLLLIISETTQQAMVGGDHSLTNCAVLVLTLVLTDIVLSFIKQWLPLFDFLLDGTAVILMKDGKLQTKRMNRERIDEEEILEAAREQLGLERLDQIKLAVLERNGQISVIPRVHASAA
jgi:uncharacterized membrane protein YcaP (DUF421 family)